MMTIGVVFLIFMVMVMIFVQEVRILILFLGIFILPFFFFFFSFLIFFLFSFLFSLPPFLFLPFFFLSFFLYSNPFSPVFGSQTQDHSNSSSNSVPKQQQSQIALAHVGKAHKYANKNSWAHTVEEDGQQQPLTKEQEMEVLLCIQQRDQIIVKHIFLFFVPQRFTLRGLLVMWLNIQQEIIQFRFIMMLGVLFVFPLLLLLLLLFLLLLLLLLLLPLLLLLLPLLVVKLKVHFLIFFFFFFFFFQNT